MEQGLLGDRPAPPQEAPPEIIPYDNVEEAVQIIFDNGTRGDAESVIRAIDDSKIYTMDIGPRTGKVVEGVIAQNKPKVLVELGGFYGYSAIRFTVEAKKHYPDAHYYTIELNPILACVIQALAEFAGLADSITVLPGTLAKNVGFLRADIHKRFGEPEFDFLLLDHWKDEYVPDLKLAQEEGFLKKGSVIVADDIIWPGVPEYKAYIEAETTLYTSTLTSSGRDGIYISYVN